MGFALGRKLNSKILVVENQADDVLLIQQAFKENPDVVLKVVSNPIQALDFLKRRNAFTSAQRPHLVIIGSGFDNAEQLDMLKEVKEDASLKTIPVIILNSSDSEQEISEAYSLHANCCVPKPDHADDFNRMLHLIVPYWVTTALLHSM